MKMADELDRVRISAAELRAEAANSVNITDCGIEEELELPKQKHGRKRDTKRPDLQRYQLAAAQGHRHRSSKEGGDHTDLKSQQSEEKKVSENDAECQGDDSGPKQQQSDGLGGDCCQAQTKTNANDQKSEHSEGSVGASKPTKKARKPDREIYQPGSRRNIQGKDSVGKDLHKPSPRKQNSISEPESHVGTGVREGKMKKSIESQRQKNRVKTVKMCDSSDDNRDQGRPKVDFFVENIANKVENLSLKEKGSDECASKDQGESGCKRGVKAVCIERGQRSESRGEDEKLTKTEKGSRHRRGAEREKNKREDGLEKKNNQQNPEKENGKRAPDSDGRKTDVTGEAHQNRRKDKRKEIQRLKDSNSNFKDAEKVPQTECHVDLVAQQSERESLKTDFSASNSKRYSKTNLQHSRNRTYSSSSASSVTSQDGLRRQTSQVHTSKWSRPGSGKERMDRNEGQRGQFGKWANNKHSSSESLEGSEKHDREEGGRCRRRRRGAEEGIKVKQRDDEKRTPKSNKSAGRGILRVSLEDQSGTSPQHLKQAPRGRGGGILVLPNRTGISTISEVGQRLFSSAARGGAAGRSRGGRGGGVRRLWDPNNPDQKPALSSTQSCSSLKQPVYLQTGTGFGQLHFLDTDDEVAGSPPILQGEHFKSQQAATMAYYKFQNSDNPYFYPMPTGNSPNTNAPTTTNQQYPYLYNMGPYQGAPPNGMFQCPGTAQFCGSYREMGYSQPGVGGGLTLEDAEQQTRGELGRRLKAADAHELQLSNLLSRDRLSADGLDRMAQLRADLLVLYERIILTDIELSDSHNVDQALWKNVFYQVIERFRQLLKDPSCDNTPDIRNMLLTLLDEGALFFDTLLQKLQTAYQFTLEDYMDGMAIRTRPLRKTVKYALISAQRCMICQGDIARYREQATNSANYGKARSWYLKAQHIAPKNGRPYNQLALLAVYTKRKLDAVYYYMRSLAASNPILTAKESLMSLFEEAKRKAEQLERRRQQEHEGGSRGPAIRGKSKWDNGARVEIWIRPNGQTTTSSSQRGGSESSRDSEQDGELGSLSATELNKRFILSFLHAHGKLFTKVGMESFPGAASTVLIEFTTLLQHGPSQLGSTNLLQIITINMFAIHNAHSRSEGGDVRSVLLEQSTALGLGMFALLVQRCTDLLRNTPADPVPVGNGEGDGKTEELVRVSAFPLDLKELLPSIKVWSDWMLGHPEDWNPPPCSLECSPDVWQCLADFCNVLARVDHEEVPLYKVDSDEGEGDEELIVLQLKEDKLLAGFVPLLAAPQEPCYTDKHTDMAIAADCKRVTVLKYFLEALCGQEEPLLAFKGGKYVSVATCTSTNLSEDARTRNDSLTEKESDDVILEAESSFSASDGEEDFDEAGDSENDIRELKARRHILANKLAQQQKRRDKIQAVLQTGGQLELEVRPLFLVPDTNGFVDHLEGLKKLLQCGTYIIVVPLIVITELDGLAKGQDPFDGGAGIGGRSAAVGGVSKASVVRMRGVQEKARLAVVFLEKGFEAREPCLRALTSRGNQLESISFRSEDTSGQQGNNDDVILSCCLHYCKDKAKDFMPPQRNGTVRLQREVVLLTDDRNLRVKALTRNVPVRDIPSFLSWAKVG